MRRLSPILLTVALALVFPAGALAQSPTQVGYGESHVLNEVDRIPPTVLDEEERPSPKAEQDDQNVPVVDRETGAPPVDTDEELPFTGLDVGIIALMGLTLVGTGFALRRTRRAQG